MGFCSGIRSEYQSFGKGQAMHKLVRNAALLLVSILTLPGAAAAQNQSKSPSAAALIKPPQPVGPRCVYDHSFQHVSYSYDGAEAEKQVMQKPLQCTLGSFIGAATTPYCKRGVAGMWACYRRVTCHQPIPKCRASGDGTAGRQ